MKKGRYFLFLSYKGTAYSGWQVQPGETTVQGTIEEALSVLLQDEIKVTGAGRTDTGVHASYFVAHFDSEESTLSEEDLVFKLNSYLPEDIAASRVLYVHKEAHARFDAISRTYKYVINRRKDPFSKNESTYIRTDLNLSLMNQASEYLKDYHDFTSFSKVHTDVKTNNCVISKAKWKEGNSKIIFEISADRFLRNMVRAIVGTMLDIGSGKVAPEEIKNIIIAKNRSSAGRSVPPDGLFLTEIVYPESY
jgi:tRNA pseudouridine38-40 synthase